MGTMENKDLIDLPADENEVLLHLPFQNAVRFGLEENVLNVLHH